MAHIVPDWQYYAMLGAAVIVPMLSILITFSVFKQIPWAWTMYKCFKNNLPVIYKHYPKGGGELEAPKLEKELKEGIPNTFYRVDEWGLKLPDIAGDNTELLMGKLRVIHCYKNHVGPANVIDAVAIDRLKEWLKTKGVDIQNKEDVVLFFLNDYTKTKNIKDLLDASSVDDEETRKFIHKTIETIEKNRDELEKLRVKDGIFTFQAAMMAIDRAMAFTSSAFANAKSAIEAQVRAKQLEDKNKELHKTILIIFVGIVCAAIAYAIIAKSGA